MLAAMIAQIGQETPMRKLKQPRPERQRAIEHKRRTIIAQLKEIAKFVDGKGRSRRARK